MIISAVRAPVAAQHFPYQYILELLPCLDWSLYMILLLGTICWPWIHQMFCLLDVIKSRAFVNQQDVNRNEHRIIIITYDIKQHLWMRHLIWVTDSMHPACGGPAHSTASPSSRWHSSREPKGPLKPETWAWFTKQRQETCMARVRHKMWACWLNTNWVTQTSRSLIPPLPDRIFWIFQGRRRIKSYSGSDKPLRRANCGFITSVWAELQLAGPSTDRLKLLPSTLLDNHRMIPVSGVWVWVHGRERAYVQKH